MNRKYFSHSLRAQIILIVVVSMSIMLIFQGVSMGNFMSEDSKRQREYMKAANETIAASLDTIGENIRSMAFYMAQFESFQNLYLPSRRKANDIADIISSVFQTVRFISNYYPIVRDVIVVGLNGIPFSYYSGSGYDFMDMMRPEYHFEDPNSTESRFFYSSGKDYFVYATPISDSFSSTGDMHKIATCIFICNMSYISDLLKIDIPDQELNFSVFDKSGQLIASKGSGLSLQNRKDGIVSGVNTMDLTVTTFVGEGEARTERYGNTRFVRAFFIFSVVLAVFITLAVIILLQYRIARPISNLVKSMVTQDNKPLHTRLASSNIEELDHIAGNVNSLLDEIEIYLKERMAAQEKLYEMELRKNEAETYALQSQINPHFLNNTLQCIRSIAITKQVDEIASISLAMSELFRYSMNYEEQVPLKEEIEIVKHFVLITNIRFRNRFSFFFQMPPELLDCPICRMTLQPLVENAVSHGISKREDGGIVEIIGRRENGMLFFEVIDNGPGFGKERLAEIEQSLSHSFSENRELHKGKSFGLYNIARRLKLHYGENYGLEINRMDNKTQVRLRFPDV